MLDRKFRFVKSACPAKGGVATGQAGVYVGAAKPLLLDAAVFSTSDGIVAILLTDFTRCA